MWDFLTCDLNHFVFHLYDHNDSGSITADQLEELADGVYGMRRGHNSKLDDLIRSKDLNGDGKLSFEEFVEVFEHNKTLQFPG